MPEIPKRTLGRTGLEVTSLGWGAMELYKGYSSVHEDITDQEAETVLNTVLDSGINFIDTSIDYGPSETLIGRFLSSRRDEYYLASKCGCVVGKRMEHLFTAANIREGVENSLRLLQTDHLDLLQFHISPSREELNADGALEEAIKLRDEGKTRFLGISATLPNLLDHLEMEVFDAFQIPYSLLQREHEDAIARTGQTGHGTIIRGGVARGKPADWNRRYYMRPGEEMQDLWREAKLDELRDGMSPIELTLRFTLSHPDVDTVIVGTRNPDHIRENVRFATAGPLPADLVTEIKRRLDEAGGGTVAL